MAAAISGSMLASARRAVSAPASGNHAVGRERALGGEERVDVDGAVAEQVVLGHRLDDVARRRRPGSTCRRGRSRWRAPAPSPGSCRGSSAACTGSRRHRPAEDAVGLGDDARVGDDLQVARARQQGDHRIEIGDRVDLAGAHRRDRAAAGADADDRDVGRLQPGLGEDEVGEHVGRRARRGDAELLALQLGDAT